MSVPQELAKYIKSQCDTDGQYRLATRTQTVIKTTGYQWDGTKKIPANSVQKQGDNVWQESGARIAFDKKYPVIKTSTSSFEVLADRDTTTNFGREKQINKESIARSNTTSRVNGIVVGSTSTYVRKYRVYGENISSVDQILRVTIDTNTTYSIVTTSDFALISCRCRDGDDIDCKDAPNGFCCIPYSLTNSLCAKLNR
jgi:hypothetical protein